jgi:signal recognition particle subunit SRP68
LIHTNFANALALIQRASGLTKPAAKSASKTAKLSSSPLKFNVDYAMLTRLDHMVKHLLIQTRAQTDLQNAKNATEQTSGKAAPLIARLDTYPEGKVDLKNLVTYPPKLRSLPVKPLFFDVAWNYIEYPGQTGAPTIAKGKVAEAEDQKPSTRRGWFGFGGAS